MNEKIGKLIKEMKTRKKIKTLVITQQVGQT